MHRFTPALLLLGVLAGPISATAADAPPVKKYFAHAVVEDRDGVIAPWYRGQNGQCDFRVRVAAETLKRYPWTDKKVAVMAAPYFVFTGSWGIKPDGTILVSPQLDDWMNADVGQRSVSMLGGMTEYYRYTGDPAAIGIMTLTADYLLDYCQTPAGHPWPNFIISAPVKGKAFGQANPHGFIQLDLCGQLGSALLGAYKVTGNPRYLAAVQHWADLLAEHCDLRPGAVPWNRHANPKDAPRDWSQKETAGMSLTLQFLNDMIRTGYRGQGDALVKARDAGEKYLRDVLLARWSDNPIFGHQFWDWDNPVYTCAVPSYTAQYMMDRREAFPQWKTDIRNTMSMFFCRSSVDPGSAGDVYSGAWAFPEASNCCGKSLQYPTMHMAAALARYAALTGDPWAREVARRQTILCTYDAHETGVVEDNVDGGVMVAGQWFNLAHPWPLRMVMEMLAWQPEWFGPARENHIMRSTSVVRDVRYGKGRVAYRTFDAEAPCEDVLRLAFTPTAVSADGKPLQLRQDAAENGYTVKPLSNGDCIVTVRHEGCPAILVEGDDPQHSVAHERLEYEGAHSPYGKKWGEALMAGARARLTFHGNQVRLIGQAGPDGGKADVYLDGVKQLCGIDCWCPQVRMGQVLCYKNGLAQGKHTLEIVATGTKNAVSRGTNVHIEGIQYSAAQGESSFGPGGGPTDTQRVIFGYVGRKDFVDSSGSAWRPATEFILRLGPMADLVPASFWTEPQLKDVAGTADPELYRYGVYGRDFTAYFTVSPQQSYHVRLKFCQAHKPSEPGGYATNIEINGRPAATDMDVAATAGGLGKAVDLVFNDIRPQHGVIAVRFLGSPGTIAMIQAIEVGPGPAGEGAKPVAFPFPPDRNRLGDAGFEEPMPGIIGVGGQGYSGAARMPWNYLFLGPNQGVIFPESAYAIHPDWGSPKPHSGKDAVRTMAMEKDAHTQVYQDLAVVAQTSYRASVWVQAVDLHGKGFGAHAGDSAGLSVIELDATGKVLIEHPKAAVTKAGGYQQLSQSLTTTANTAKLRFLLDTVIGCRYDQGHVTYDDCTLVREVK
ncbi:MAG: malectin domain-containing carbohydrate-binding protein [Thermoguttaceae bacterium]